MSTAAPAPGTAQTRPHTAEAPRTAHRSHTAEGNAHTALGTRTAGDHTSAPDGSGQPAAPHRRRRWHRIAIPVMVFLILVIGTVVLHSLNEPDPTDPAFLSPVAPADSRPISGSLLAQRLEDRGVRVQRFTKTSDALSAAYQGGVTLFVPSPSLIHRDYLRMLWNMPSNTRVVLVDPRASDLARGNAPITVTGRRWATAAVPPGGQCAIPGLADVGPAAVFETRYAVDPDLLLREHSCYRGSVLQFRWTVAEVIAVGSADPFRDDRIDQYDNSALAVGLLSQHQDLLWLDVHETEPGPLVDPDAVPGDGVPPSLAPGGGYGEPSPGAGDGTDGGAGDPGGSAPDDGSGGGQAGGPAGSDQPSFFDAFPPALWATLVGALLVGLLLALWQARRLGPPVTEPLPFTVKGSETVLGRARLYQRAGAMLTGAQTLRRVVGPQIAQALGLPPTATPPQLAAALTERHGGDPAAYLALLSDELPKKDSDLVTLAADLDALLAMVSAPAQPHGTPATQGETSG